MAAGEPSAEYQIIFARSARKELEALPQSLELMRLVAD